VIDLVTGTSDSTEAEQLRADFKVCLGTDDLSNVTVDELLTVIEPECPVARLNYKKSAMKVPNEVELVAQEDKEAQE